MEFITPTFEIWPQETKKDSLLESMWAHIARCTRVCYQSEKKDNGESEEAFVKRVILRHEPLESEANHLSMLEHGTIYLKAHKISYKTMLYTNNKYSKVCIHEDAAYITTNLRVLIENDCLYDLQFMCVPTKYHPKRVTVSFTTNIGVTREFNRHRVDSPSEESTRYCNYNRRNDGQIKICLPAWFLNEEHLPYIESHQFDKLSSYCEEYLNDNSDINPECWCDMDFYLFSLTVSEYCYNMLIKKGWKPQQAREVLPLATKSQLVHTAFVDDWKHFFALRADGVSGPVHPNASLLAKPLKEEFIKLGLL